jgi:hypothetical protein
VAVQRDNGKMARRIEQFHILLTIMPSKRPSAIANLGAYNSSSQKKRKPSRTNQENAGKNQISVSLVALLN